MRPKKSIILMAGTMDEGTYRTVLSAMGYRVHSALTVMGAHLAAKNANNTRAIVAVRMTDEVLIALDGPLPIVAVVRHSTPAIEDVVDATVISGTDEMRAVLDALNVVTVLKRGAKPSVRVEQREAVA